MAADNKLELVVEVDVNKANASIKSVNAGLSTMEQTAAKAARGASAGIDGMTAAMVKGATAGNLLAEGISREKIHVTGNTVVDAVKQNLVLSDSHNVIVNELGLEEQCYFLLTLHRAENVDDGARLKSILKALKDLGREYKVDVVFPIHPRTKKMIKEFGLSTRGLTTVNPVGLGWRQWPTAPSAATRPVASAAASSTTPSPPVARR